jgi:uncharacterized protein
MKLTVAPTTPVSSASPVLQKERIVILDSLRGFAILGILLMNIPAFGLPGLTGDPSVLNETGVNFNTWYYVSLIPDGTQRALFSMLFGAGIILFVRSAEKKGDGIRPADLFFRRQLWLLVFSLFDVFVLLWHGDILLDYALWGMVLFTFRNLSPKALLIAAGVCLLMMLARENRDFYKDKKIIARGEAVAILDTTKVKLSPAQKEQLGAMTAFKERASIEKKQERVEANLRKVGQSNYEDLYEFRTDRYIGNLVLYIFFWFWDVLLFMFVGMAFFKMGILTGQAPAKVYWWMLIVGLGAGILLTFFYLQPYIQYNFNRFEYTKNVTVEYFQLGRVLRSLGLFAALMLLYKSGLLKWLFAMMRPVGQMAFTNYLMQSLLCGIFFYSIGFAMYGRLERHEIYYVVGAIWIFQIIFSHIWLRYFRFGPFEWAWRTLTYWKRQPMKKIHAENNIPIA